MVERSETTTVTHEHPASPDYSPYARQYAKSRPGYPPELFTYLASLVDRHERAWDCGTGNGQAARGLAGHFNQVIATDVSTEQIKNAAPHPRIEFRVATAEDSGLEDQSLDLVTVAAAIHWFDLDRFYAEVKRVMRPGGVLAAWTYHIGHMEPPFDVLFSRFYSDVLAPYFAANARLVDNRYESITLPGTPIDPIDLSMNANWTLDQMLGFIRSWSGTQAYLKERGQDPVDLIASELLALWDDPQRVHELHWPLYSRISRLP